MGLLPDGRAKGSIGGAANEKMGIGRGSYGENPMDVNDFRMQMGIKYQENNERRSKGIYNTQK